MKRVATRRNTILGLSAALGSLSAASARAAIITPRASEGPYYPTPGMRRADVDNDLVKVRSLVEAARGEVVVIRGMLRGRSGAPLAGHRVEIWQCDVDGNYMHPSDRRSGDHDTGFQGFGHDISREDGSFTFRTIKPATYPGRTPHIHVKVLKGQRDILTTQFYIAGHPDNRRDGLFRRMSDSEADAVSMTFQSDGDDTVTDIKIII